MPEVVYMTKERVKELEEEVRDLKIRGRKEIAQKIAEARSHGDLSENAEYDAALHDQQIMEMKITNLERTLSKVQVITPDELPNDKIYILSKVKLKNKSNGSMLEYMLVSPEEADFERRKISVTSPIGKALLGRVVGDTAEINAPAGKIQYEVLEIYK